MNQGLSTETAVTSSSTEKVALPKSDERGEVPNYFGQLRYDFRAELARAFGDFSFDVEPENDNADSDSEEEDVNFERTSGAW